MGVTGGPSIPQSGMQLNLDASNSKSSPGSGTTWSDVSGNGRDFTWTSEPTYNTRPVVGDTNNRIRLIRLWLVALLLIPLE